jgi:hypothetical protein
LKYKILWLLFFYLFIGSALSDPTLHQFAMFIAPAMDAKHCVLVERYSDSHDTTKYHGKLEGSGCGVSIAKNTYEDRFSFCFLSGINSYRITSGASSECFIQQRDSDYLFYAFLSGSLNNESQLMCYFSCIGK